MEIERKYLVDVIGDIPNSNVSEIEQTYLVPVDGKERRIRKRGENGNYIYFPHAGSTRVVDEIYCWTTDMSPGANQHAICYHIQSFWGMASKSWEDRCVGLTIRAVCP